MTSNDPVNPTTEIHVKAFVEVVFGFESSSLRIGDIHKEESVTKTAFIQVKDKEVTKITDIITSSPFITAREVNYTDTIGANEKFKIEIAVSPGLPIGRIRETITVRSNLEQRPETKLGLYGNVIGDVEVKPASLSFAVRDSEDPQLRQTKKLIITNHQKDNPLEILNVYDPDNYLELEVRTKEKGSKFELQVILKGKELLKGNKFGGTIIITTNNPDEKKIVVPYKLYRGK